MDVNTLLERLEIQLLDAESNIQQARQENDGENALYNMGIAEGLRQAIKEISKLT